jgi:sugar-specific transcriptional regulator TrmB
MSPQGLNQKSGIPRPRTYDVLNGLLGKGLLLEEPGKPRIYAAVEPRVGLETMLADIERKMFRQLEEKKETTAQLILTLSKLHDESRRKVLDENRVWVTRKDRAVIATFTESIRNLEKEMIVATAAIQPPEAEILSAIKYALKNDITVRILRPITELWTRVEIEEYEGLIRLGGQVKYQMYDELSFAVHDKKRIVLWMPPSPFQFTVSILLPSLATVLYKHFEVLWEKGQPALPVLENLKKAKV